MIFVSPTTTFILSLIVIITFVSATMLYFWFVYIPYAKFPACRVEHRILYWMFKRIPLNHAILEMLIEQSKRYESEGLFAVWLGVPALCVYGEDIVKKIMCERVANDKPRCYKLMDFAINKSLLTSNGGIYKKQLKMAAPAFHVSALKSHTAIMNKHSEEVVERLSGLVGQPTDDIVNITGLFAMKTIHESNLGQSEVTDEEYTHVTEVLNKTTDFMIKRVCSPWLFLDISLKLFPSARKMQQLVSNVLDEHFKPRLEKIKVSLLSQQASPDESYSDHGGRRFKPFGELFVEQNLQNPTFTMDDITHQVAFLLPAAFHSLPHTLKFVIYLLGLHQDVQDRAFEEVMDETEGHVSYEDQQRLTYLECVIKETLRLYPAGPIIGRKLNKDLQCGEYKLPRNTCVGLFLYMLHRNPKIYPDPEKFDPERFLAEDSKIKPWHFIPFAEGSRPCLGKNFAMIEMKILMAHVLRNFRIVTLDRIEESDLSWSLVLLCRKSPRIQFLPRTKI